MHCAPPLHQGIDTEEPKALYTVLEQKATAVGGVQSAGIARSVPAASMGFTIVCSS